MRPAKIISGGQTGCDLGALRAAAALGIPTGGTCPRNCRTELGDRPWLIGRYGLTEHGSSQYRPRTVANVRAADATVVFGEVESPGTRTTLELIEWERKPKLVNPTATALRDWVAFGSTTAGRAVVLNVAGNRESGNPGVEAAVFAILVAAWPREDGRAVAAPWPKYDPVGMAGLQP